MLELREELKDKVDIQIVAFPQQGMYSYKGGRELVEEALKMGADVVGGIPHYEPAREFGEKSIHEAVKLALKYDKLIDIHCDETDDPQSRFVELLNALVPVSYTHLALARVCSGFCSRRMTRSRSSFGALISRYASKSFSSNILIPPFQGVL